MMLECWFNCVYNDTSRRRVKTSYMLQQDQVWPYCCGVCTTTVLLVSLWTNKDYLGIWKVTSSNEGEVFKVCSSTGFG